MMRRIAKLFRAAFYLIMLMVGFPCGKLLEVFTPAYRDAWLISERGTDARDNGYWFFKYMQEEHGDINTYYVIDKSSDDYGKLKKYRNIIQYKSFRHHVMLAIASVRISTHDMGYTPDMVIYHWLNRMHLIPGKKVLLQHGIMGTDIEWYHKNQCDVDLFITSSVPEYRYIVDCFGQGADVVRLTGLCRYDHLERGRQKKQVLIMPTWRQYLVGLTEKEFVESDYYKNYMHLLNDEEFLGQMRKQGYSVVFYPHIEMQKFIHLFHSSNPSVRIAFFGSDDVQQLLIESDVLVTDFSSVFFDAAYLGHRILYFQFDKSSFEGSHYKKCWFDYGSFGPVCRTVEELEKELYQSVSVPGIQAEYEQAMHDFFAFHDDGNCKRVYQEIVGML